MVDSTNGSACVSKNLWFSYEVAENISSTKAKKILKDGGLSVDAPRAQYDQGTEVVHKLQLRNVSFEIPYGSRMLLLGANGAGKSTLLSILGGKHMVDTEEVRVLGRPAFHDTTLSKDVALLTGNWTRTVNFVGHGIPYQAMEVGSLMDSAAEGVDPERVKYLSEMLEVNRDWNLTEVSDGQRRRVQIFCKLVKPFKLLLLDEITTDLDLLARQNLMAFLKTETEKHGVTVVYCTHIFDGMDGWATHAMYVADTEMKFCKPTTDVPELLKLSTNGHGVLFTAVQEWLLQRAEHFRPMILDQSRPSVPPPAAEPNVVVKNLTWRYSGSRAKHAALEGVNCSFVPGSRVLLVGANGSGKTTLLKLLGGKHMIDREAIKLCGLSAFHDTELNNKVALLSGDWTRTVACVGAGVPFHADFSFGFMAKNLMDTLALEFEPAFLQARFERLTNLLEMDMEWRMNKVSDGQRRRCQLLLKLLRPSEVLLMDEVTTDLDLVSRQALLCFLREESEQRNVTVVYATHIFDGLDRWPTHIMRMQYGKVVFCGPTADLPTPMVEDTHGSGGLFNLARGWLLEDFKVRPTKNEAAAQPVVAMQSAASQQSSGSKFGGGRFDRFGSGSSQQSRCPW